LTFNRASLTMTV